MTAVGVAERSGVRISFLQYLAYGVPMTLAAIGICQIYVWLRYF
jgi:Na+/H+ antiporter NhaD/arsenite permease-like protein